MSRAVYSTVALTFLLVACGKSDSSDAPDASTLPADCTRTDLDTPPAITPHTPRWAFEPWISKDISDRDDNSAYVGGFQDRGIPLGTVVLDSPWETNYNTFVPNAARYGDFPSLVQAMHGRGVHVVLWITAIVNQQSFDLEVGGDSYPLPSPNYDDGTRCNYFIDDNTQYGWWKGFGSSLDFFNPSARAWWHRQQDVVLKSNIDGWKLDFGDTYVPTDPVKTSDGMKPHQEYSEAYYEDFLAYGRSARGPDFLTMTRAWDESYAFPGRFYAKKENAPIAWMGDNRRDYVGLADALNEMFISARAGYPVVGSDIGGYLDHDDKDLLGPAIPFDSLVFARWTAVGALSPLMQLHGRGAIAPWTLPDHADETVALYTYWATLHHALVPFFYSLAEKAYAAGLPADGSLSLVQPVGDAASWSNDYRYLLGDALLVAPIVDATGQRTVPLPAGARFYDWWSSAVAEGGTTATADFSADRAKLPLYVKEGAIIPVDIDTGVLALGDATSKGARTILAWPAAAKTEFSIHEADDSVVDTSLVASGTGFTFTIGASSLPLILRVRSDVAPTTVTGDGVTFTYDAASKTTIVRAPARSAAVTIQAQ